MTAAAAAARAANTAAQTDLVNAEHALENARIIEKAQYSVKTAVRARYGMKNSDANCYLANDTSTRYADVKNADAVWSAAVDAVADARAALENARAVAAATEQTLYAYNVADAQLSISDAFYGLVRFITKRAN